jgi:hypothetical protein
MGNNPSVECLENVSRDLEACYKALSTAMGAVGIVFVKDRNGTYQHITHSRAHKLNEHAIFFVSHIPCVSHS